MLSSFSICTGRSFSSMMSDCLCRPAFFVAKICLFTHFFVPSQRIMRKVAMMMVCMLLLTACGLSYKEQKRVAAENRKEAQRQDSVALKVAVMPTLDCLPLFVAEYHQLFDTIYGGVRLKYYKALMDCDTALQRARVEGTVSDLVRAKYMEKRGLKLRYVATTSAYWQLISNRNMRIRQLKQLDDKMVAMTRFSATDMLTDLTIDSVKLDREKVFKVQVNDVNVRMLMLQNNEMDALWMTEPQATMARMLKNPVLLDSRQAGLQLGVIVFREKEMQRQARSKQMQLFVNAYNMACDSINKYGVGHYRDLIMSRCDMKKNMVDSLPQDIKYVHVRGPLQKDIEAEEKWMKQ